MSFCCEEPERSGEFYRQCSLVKGNRRQTSWVPEKFARVGLVLRLRNADKVWIPGWLVVSVSETKRQWEELGDGRLTQRSH